MKQSDLIRVAEIAALVHPSYPEDSAVFAERLTLHAAGCHVLGDEHGALVGYVLGHPWLFGEPPALNTRLVRLPDRPTTYYLHDIALLPEARGGGHANGMARSIVHEARIAGFASVSLVAVNDSAPFWAKHGFRAVSDPALAERLRSYDAGAGFMVREL
jgi:ribosomal protein S18 acetylase RimI-like enzyme